MNNFDVFISFQDSLQIYPKNEAGNFIVQLPKTIILSGGAWRCAVNSIRIKKSVGEEDTVAVITSDLCEDTLCYGTYASILSEFMLKKDAGWHEEIYTSPRFVSLRKDSMSFFTVNIRPLKENERLALLDARIHLIFKKIPGCH